MGRPTGPVRIKSLGKDANLFGAPIARIRLLGGFETLRWTQTADGLEIALPQSVPSDIATVLKITPKE